MDCLNRTSRLYTSLLEDTSAAKATKKTKKTKKTKGGAKNGGRSVENIVICGKSGFLEYSPIFSKAESGKLRDRLVAGWKNLASPDRTMKGVSRVPVDSPTIKALAPYTSGSESYLTLEHVRSVAKIITESPACCCRINYSSLVFLAKNNPADWLDPASREGKELDLKLRTAVTPLIASLKKIKTSDAWSNDQLKFVLCEMLFDLNDRGYQYAASFLRMELRGENTWGGETLDIPELHSLSSVLSPKPGGGETVAAVETAEEIVSTKRQPKAGRKRGRTEQCDAPPPAKKKRTQKKK